VTEHIRLESNIGISCMHSYSSVSKINDQPIYPIWSLYLHPLRRYERRYKIPEMG